MYAELMGALGTWETAVKTGQEFPRPGQSRGAPRGKSRDLLGLGPLEGGADTKGMERLDSTQQK